METTDIILDNAGELQAVNGDFKQGDNANNLIRYIVEASKGHYKEFPLTGFGIHNYLNSNTNAQIIRRNLKVELTSDVFPNPFIDVSGFPSEIIINKEVLKFES